jgi:hypothetical protein
MFLPMLSFVGGLSTEALAVLWVHFAERNDRYKLFAIAVLQGTANVCGIGGAISGWPCAVAYVVGYGCGPLLGIYVKGRMGSHRPPR